MMRSRSAYLADLLCCSASSPPVSLLLLLQVMAIGQTRLYLEQDGKDIRAWPEFVKVQKAGGELNAIKFHIHVDRLR
jgi:hypothetical protein